jgi:non-ribosomal peptide synthetase component F
VEEAVLLGADLDPGGVAEPGLHELLDSGGVRAGSGCSRTPSSPNLLGAAPGEGSVRRLPAATGRESPAEAYDQRHFDGAGGRREHVVTIATVRTGASAGAGAGAVLSFADPLERALHIAAGRPAVVSGDTRLDFRQLADRCRRLVGAVRRLGLAPGDRVALLMANGHRYLECYLGLPAAGFVIVPLNARLSDPELRYILADAACASW